MPAELSARAQTIYAAAHMQTTLAVLCKAYKQCYWLVQKWHRWSIPQCEATHAAMHAQTAPALLF